MLDTLIHEKVKKITKRLNSTQASVVNGLVEFALDNITDDDLENLNVSPAKPRGRKKIEDVTQPAVVEAETESVEAMDC